MAYPDKAGDAKIAKGNPVAWLSLPDGRSHMLTGASCSIGRTPPREILFVHPFVSGAHAVIELDPSGAHRVRDLGSKNGTYLEGRKIQQPSLLHHGAKIKIGPFELLYQKPAAADGGSTTQIQSESVAPVMKAAPAASVQRIAILAGETVGDTALKSFLKGQPDLAIIHSVTSPSALLRNLRTKPAGFIIANLSTAQVDTLALIQDLAALDSKPGLFLMGEAEHALLLQRALVAGALGASFNSDGAEETLACIRASMTGSKSVTHAVATVVSIGDSGRSGQAKAAGPEKLSDREIAVFHLIGAGKQNREIAEILGISVKTVETHKENIKVKLSIAGSARLAEVAKGWFKNSTP
jgi:DNA-binding NarL/FixJ family response regulator